MNSWSSVLERGIWQTKFRAIWICTRQYIWLSLLFRLGFSVVVFFWKILKKKALLFCCGDFLVRMCFRGKFNLIFTKKTMKLLILWSVSSDHKCNTCDVLLLSGYSLLLSAVASQPNDPTLIVACTLLACLATVYMPFSQI